MQVIKKLGTILTLLCILSSTLAFADDKQKLFVNLTSDEINRAAMAIGFSTKILTQKKIPVTIFLNVEGARIADKNIPEQKYANGKSLKQMLTDFINAGGQVLICPMCMKNVAGISKDDLLPGVKVGGPDVTWPALFAEDTTVLSY
jgi:predicted peroxiredoxin